MPTEMGKFKAGKLVFARLNEDEDVSDAVLQVAKRNNISTGLFFLIGTLKKANLGFYCDGKYKTSKVDEPLEIVSCMGNVSIRENEPFIHAHVAVSNEKGEVFGGHLMPGCAVAATVELILIEAVNGKLRRKFDAKTQLHLWSLSE